LPETLASVWQQTFTDFEVVIVDDGSSDDIQEWVSRIDDARIKLISQANQGASAARNNGIRAARGEYIAFLDADDLWMPTKLETHVDYLDKNPDAGLVYSWTAITDARGKPTGRVMTPTEEGDIFKKILARNIVVCPSVMVRRCCFDKVGLFIDSLRFNEDWEMWIRIASQYDFAVIKEPLVYYRQHANNTSKKWQSMQEGYRFVIEKAFQSVPPELKYLKNHSYGNANLILAWKAIQSQSQDWKLAAQFRGQAISCYPQVIFCHEFWRLSFAIALMHYLGSQGYSRFLEFAYTLRRRVSTIFNKDSTRILVTGGRASQ
jgi:glycosyltransferase involved in cell wall biosynthesis